MSRIPHVAYACLFVVTTCIYSGRATGDDQAVDNLITEFDRSTRTAVEQDGGGCVMVAVFHRDEIRWSRGYGFADVERRIPATAETIGRTGSISKSFTAVVVAQLAERGVLQLDDPVRTRFPAITGLSGRPTGSEKITWRMLASHTAGLAREPRRLSELASGPIELWEQKVLDAIPLTTFRTPPRTEYSYSNIGFGILGLAASRAADKPFMDLVSDQIFEPLEMQSSTFIIGPAMRQRLAVGYVHDRRTGSHDPTVPTREHAGRGYKVPNGGIYSTVGDLARFAAAVMGQTDVSILSSASRRELIRPQDPARNYGLGFSVGEVNGHLTAGHGGSVAGYRADLRFAPKTGWGVAVLRTTQFNPPTRKLLIDVIDAASR